MFWYSLSEPLIIMDPLYLVKLENNTKAISIYPNPADSNIKIRGMNEKQLVSIYSITGHKISEQFVNS